MSATRDDDAPNPSFDQALDAFFADEPAAPEGGAPVATQAPAPAQTTDAAPTAAPDATPGQDTPDAQTPTELAQIRQQLSDLAAQNAEYQRQIANREWSSEGRYKAEVKKREAIEAELTAERQRLADVDGRENQRWEAQIARATDPETRDYLQTLYDADKTKREGQRALAQAQAERARFEADQAAATEVTQARATALRQRQEGEVRASALPSLLDVLTQEAQANGLGEAEVARLRRAIDTPAKRRTYAAMPLQLLAQTVAEEMGWVIGEVRAANERQAAGNRQQAAQTGAFGVVAQPAGGVPAARAEIPNNLRTQREIADAAVAFFEGD